MRYLPVGLDTREKNILVLGGGHMAYQAIKTLAKTEATIYVINEIINDDIKKLADNYENRFKLKEEELTENFIFMGYDYVIIATENFEINQAMEKRAIDKRMAYERMDIVSSSSIILNKVLEYGPITVGLNNSKNNSVITNRIYKDIEKLLDSYTLEKFTNLNSIRTELIRKNTLNADDVIELLYDEKDQTIKDFLSKMKEYKIEGLEAAKDLLTSLKNRSSINLEKEETNKEKVIEDNINEFKNNPENEGSKANDVTEINDPLSKDEIKNIDMSFDDENDDNNK
ncbi:precorrin-2 dehydrogenase/sirohydrochlorin ferrochelatase family protein [Peptoniphilus raoultii]|uniref:precorrin-2 dehydrogenase/sirohydrochlorin ferrochelatase family protein n=1 Tax=Peptoniphilus raoultii TaxID=1776387 RepID=UPI0008D91FBB|nr:NAD(P)-dependent oxidoreductase [Peptoniphilus raoultii]